MSENNRAYYFYMFTFEFGNIFLFKEVFFTVQFTNIALTVTVLANGAAGENARQAYILVFTHASN